jgi:hypothetical protein
MAETMDVDSTPKIGDEVILVRTTRNIGIDKFKPVLYSPYFVISCELIVKDIQYFFDIKIFLYEFKSRNKNNCSLLVYHNLSSGRDCQFIGFFDKTTVDKKLDNRLFSDFDSELNSLIITKAQIDGIINKDNYYEEIKNDAEFKCLKLVYGAQKQITIKEVNAEIKDYDEKIIDWHSLRGEYVIVANKWHPICLISDIKTRDGTRLSTSFRREVASNLLNITHPSNTFDDYIYKIRNITVQTDIIEETIDEKFNINTELIPYDLEKLKRSELLTHNIYDLLNLCNTSIMNDLSRIINEKIPLERQQELQHKLQLQLEKEEAERYEQERIKIETQRRIEQERIMKIEKEWDELAIKLFNKVIRFILNEDETKYIKFNKKIEEGLRILKIIVLKSFGDKYGDANSDTSEYRKFNELYSSSLIDHTKKQKINDYFLNNIDERDIKLGNKKMEELRIQREDEEVKEEVRKKQKLRQLEQDREKIAEETRIMDRLMNVTQEERDAELEKYNTQMFAVLDNYKEESDVNTKKYKKNIMEIDTEILALTNKISDLTEKIKRAKLESRKEKHRTNIEKYSGDIEKLKKKKEELKETYDRENQRRIDFYADQYKKIEDKIELIKKVNDIIAKRSSKLKRTTQVQEKTHHEEIGQREEAQEMDRSSKRTRYGSGGAATNDYYYKYIKYKLKYLNLKS